MPFKDTKEGQTHYFGDGCKPPHRCPEGTCERAFGGVCKVCNCEMNTHENRTVKCRPPCAICYSSISRNIGEDVTCDMPTPSVEGIK